MFKKEKDLVQRSTTLLKNKEIKNLSCEILKQCTSLTETDTSEFFNKKVTVSVMKLASRTLIYSVNDIPMFYDKEGRNDLYPTIFFLWRFPHTLRNIIIHSPVSDFILNGADLMLPGLATIKSNELIIILFYEYSYRL
jgi:translation initiation factor 2D